MYAVLHLVNQTLAGWHHHCSALSARTETVLSVCCLRFLCWRRCVVTPSSCSSHVLLPLLCSFPHCMRLGFHVFVYVCARARGEERDWAVSPPAWSSWGSESSQLLSVRTTHPQRGDTAPHLHPLDSNCASASSLIARLAHPLGHAVWHITYVNHTCLSLQVWYSVSITSGRTDVQGEEICQEEYRRRIGWSCVCHNNTENKGIQLNGCSAGQTSSVCWRYLWNVNTCVREYTTVYHLSI